MATDRKSDEILLNALVDGELSPAEHAAAAVRLRTDKEFARAYATLARLKAFVAEIADEDEAPRIELAAPAPKRRRLVAVSAALAAAAAILLFIVLLPLERRDPVQMTRSAPEKVVAVAFAGEAVIPDLTAAGLKLARTVVSTSGGAQSLVATYLGPRGCRLELWVGNAASKSASPAGTERRSWQVGDLVYELIAFGMPASRFGKVAAFAEKATRATVPPDDAERLIQARVKRPPCVA